MIKSTNDLVRIAAAGGGFHVKAGTKPVNDLVTIAAAASRNGARIVVSNSAHLPTDDLARIGAAGKGSVIFED